MINKQLHSQPQSEFVSQELALAGALLAWGFPLTFIDRVDPTRVTFHFSRSPELDMAIQEYWNGSGRVVPKLYFSSLRELKSRIRGG